MNAPVLLFAAINIRPDEIRDKRVLEIGALDVNGSVRPLIESYRPLEYCGVDLAAGPGVDRVCEAKDLVATFGENSFDAVISTELLEHVRDWRAAVSNMKRVCRPGGILVITTRSRGFPYHAFPHDFWRFEIEDMRRIFSDLDVIKVESDPQKGVLVKAVKPAHFAEQDLSGIELFSIITAKRMREITDRDMAGWSFRGRIFRTYMAEYAHKFINIVFNTAPR